VSPRDTEPHTTPKARPPPPPMQVPTTSRTLTNSLDRSQASSPTPVPRSRAASRIGKKGRQSRPSSIKVPAAAGAAVVALFPDRIPSPQEYSAAARTAAQQQQASGQPNHIITEGWAHVINQSIDDPQAADDLIQGAKKQDPSNRDVMTAILAPILSLQTQIIDLAEKQASTTSTVSFLADETNRIRLGVAKLQQEAGRIQKAPAPAPRPPKTQPQPYQQGYAPPPPATLLSGAANLGGPGQISNQMLAQYAHDQKQASQQPPRRKTPAPSSTPCIQADNWVEVTNKRKGKAKTFVQAAAAAEPPQQQAPAAPPACKGLVLRFV